jgi:hypothetical protein
MFTNNDSRNGMCISYPTKISLLIQIQYNNTSELLCNQRQMSTTHTHKKNWCTKNKLDENRFHGNIGFTEEYDLFHKNEVHNLVHFFKLVLVSSNIISSTRSTFKCFKKPIRYYFGTLLPNLCLTSMWLTLYQPNLVCMHTLVEAKICAVILILGFLHVIWKN